MYWDWRLKFKWRCLTDFNGISTHLGLFYPQRLGNCIHCMYIYKLDEPDMQDTAGEAGTSSKVMYSYGSPHMAKQKQDDQLEHTYSSYVRIWDVALKTCQRRWTIGRSGEKGSGISMQAAQHDDDDQEGLSTWLYHIKYSYLIQKIYMFDS